jgi:hypothetical protein
MLRGEGRREGEDSSREGWSRPENLNQGGSRAAQGGGKEQRERGPLKLDGRGEGVWRVWPAEENRGAKAEEQGL